MVGSKSFLEEELEKRSGDSSDEDSSASTLVAKGPPRAEYPGQPSVWQPANYSIEDLSVMSS